MKRKPTQDEWQTLAELIASGVVRDDESIFGIQSVMAWRPEYGKPIDEWVRQRVYLFRRRKARPLPDEYVKRDWPEFLDFDAVDAGHDLAVVRERVGPAAFAVLKARYGDGLSVNATAKRLGITKDDVWFIESEALSRASSVGAGHG